MDSAYTTSELAYARSERDYVGAAQPKASEITMLIKNLYQELDTLKTVCISLVETIQPILMPEPPSPNKSYGETAPAAMTPIGVELDSLRRQITNLSDDLRSVVNRVAL